VDSYHTVTFGYAFVTFTLVVCRLRARVVHSLHYGYRCSYVRFRLRLLLRLVQLVGYGYRVYRLRFLPHTVLHVLLWVAFGAGFRTAFAVLLRMRGYRLRRFGWFWLGYSALGTTLLRCRGYG